MTSCAKCVQCIQHQLNINTIGRQYHSHAIGVRENSQKVRSDVIVQTPDVWLSLPSMGLPPHREARIGSVHSL